MTAPTQKAKTSQPQYDHTRLNETLDMDALKEYIRSTSKTTAIYIGCDSKRFVRRGVSLVAYVTVVVAHLDQSRGGRLFKIVDVQRDYGITMRQRLMNEVYAATTLAYELLDCVEDRPFAVHLDINPDPNHKSSVVVKEATGYVMGMLGIQPVLKPNSIASSSAADAITVKIADVRKRDRKAPR